MGKVITTWSPYHGQCKTTATTIALASTVPNSVITHIQPKMSNMENMCGFVEPASENQLNDIGFNSLIYTAMSKQVSKEDVETSVIQVTDKMALLPSLGQNKNDITRNMLAEHILTEILPKYYQYIFIDLGTDTSELAKELQEKADTNIIVLSQNKFLWKKYNQTEHDRYILAGYDEKSRYSKKMFQWNVSRHVDVVPLCTEYADAISAGDVKNFFLRNEKILNNPNKYSELYEFFQKLKEVKI